MKLSLLNDLKNGTSIIEGVRFRHPTLQDDVLLEELQDKFLALAIKRGLPPFDEAVKIANKNGLWTEPNERELTSFKGYLSNLQESYDKITPNQKSYFEEELFAAKTKFSKLLEKKNVAIGKTAEDWANKLSYERYVLKLVINSSGDPFWNGEDHEFLNDEDVAFYLSCFFKLKEIFSEENIKELACSGYCQNLAYLQGKSNFFDKPLFDLTLFQQRFCLFVNYYNDIIKNIQGKVSDEFLSNWKELERWVKYSEKEREQLEKSWGGKNKDLNFENIRRAAIQEGNQ